MDKATELLYFQSFNLKLAKGDLRKLQIIEASIDCLAERGMEGGTFDLVARQLKIRRSHVAYYFKERSELLVGAVQFCIASGQQITIERLRNAKTPIEQIDAMVEGAFIWADRYPKQARVLVLFHYYCSTNPAFAKLQSQIRAAGSNRIRAILESAQSERSLKSAKGKAREVKAANPAEADTVAKAIQVMMTGALVEMLTTDAKSEKRDYRELAMSECRGLATSFIDGRRASQK